MPCDTLPQQLNSTATPTLTFVGDNTWHCPGGSDLAGQPTALCCTAERLLCALRPSLLLLDWPVWKRMPLGYGNVEENSRTKVLRSVKDTNNSPRSPLQVWGKPVCTSHHFGWKGLLPHRGRAQSGFLQHCLVNNVTGAFAGKTNCTVVHYTESTALLLFAFCLSNRASLLFSS